MNNSISCLYLESSFDQTTQLLRVQYQYKLHDKAQLSKHVFCDQYCCTREPFWELLSTCTGNISKDKNASMVVSKYPMKKSESSPLSTDYKKWCCYLLITKIRVKENSQIHKIYHWLFTYIFSDQEQRVKGMIWISRLHEVIKANSPKFFWMWKREPDL